MSCNSCAKPYSLLRTEKGCPGCGFSYCSKCLNEKLFIPKLNCEAKVCAKCKRKSQLNKAQEVQPPDAYYKRLTIAGNKINNSSLNPQTGAGVENKDQEILERLKKLKEDSKNAKPNTTEEIEKRLQNIKEKVPKTTTEELQERLAKLRGIPIPETDRKPISFAPDLRTEQEQADDLMKEYLEKVKIESKYKDQFNELVSDIETRLNKLKGSAPGPSNETAKEKETLPELEDEDEMTEKILAKVKSQIDDDDDDDGLPLSTNDELPFCEICNEDAEMRCLGCRYLFCKQCFVEHKDDDDGCNRYEPYNKPPKGSEY